MPLSRRQFIKSVGVVGATTSTVGQVARASEPKGLPSPEAMGVLVDLSNCVGCRKCEFACRRSAGFDCPPIDAFDDKSVFASLRRPSPTEYTVVNRFDHPLDSDKAVFVKANCLHCVDPACVSACLVGALQKQENGAVTYEAWKCMGCRYCMIACPFQMPTYEYDNALTPQVRKCTFCFDHLREEGGVPACVKICPQECLTFGRRDELLHLAHERIAAQPDRYVDHVYGEQEAGGTSWLYLSSVPFEKLGFLALGPSSPSRLTEAIQHGVFKHFFPPLALFALLGIIMRLTRKEHPEATSLSLPVLDHHNHRHRCTIDQQVVATRFPEHRQPLASCARSKEEDS